MIRSVKKKIKKRVSNVAFFTISILKASTEMLAIFFKILAVESSDVNCQTVFSNPSSNFFSCVSPPSFGT